MKINGQASHNRSLTPKQKLRQLLDYYKLPLFLVLLLLYVIGYLIYKNVTHQEVVLYTGVVNVAADEQLEGLLTADYMTGVHPEENKQKVVLYKNWYLTDDEESEYYQYSYASGMKILAAIDARQLDVVLMNKEAFDAFAQNGYLEDLKAYLPETLYRELEPDIVTNIEILEDNADELRFDPDAEYTAETTSYEMALDVTHLDCFADRDWSDEIYLGIIRQSPRKEEICCFVQYMTHSKSLLH